MKKYTILFFCCCVLVCQNFGQLELLSNVPKVLREVSGMELIANSDLIWMLNDGGNSPKIYGVSKKGKIIKTVAVRAKNHDWEDLTSDKQGNIYIGDFGNNLNRRKNLSILKIKYQDLINSKNIEVERIQFYYPKQKKFPPKKKSMYFDAEAFFYFNQSFYIFTKSRVKNDYGKTFLYKIPATIGNHKAAFIATFSSCDELECWITSADISADGSKMVLLTQKTVLVFSDFKEDNFFSGTLRKVPLLYRSQKEGICFQDKNTLLITDEKAHGKGGNLYRLKL